ncbi:MAG: HAMP domain-containing histidine kinase [Chloroflexi bacterium]|nr:HAMP domain-containing histidine kinase [Chloroflexota bacterium]
MLVGRQSIGAVSLQVSTAQLDARLREAIQQGRLVALMAVVAGAGIALLVSRAFTRPIQEIAGVARRITGGDLTTRVNLESRNEIGQLAQAFNGMLDAIQKRETELTEQAEALRIATAKAKEAARVKGEFLANVSHELRTPLNAIIGFSDMLLAGMSGPLNDKQQHKLTRLKDNGARLLNLINDLLDLTRIEAGRVEMIEKPYAPQGLVQRMSAQMESLAAASGLKFEAVVDPLMPPMVVGDEKRVEQVIVNLISNAIKFTKEGSVSICLAAHPADDTWTLSVIDTGIGIPPHALNIIFEEFRQLDGSYSRAYKGSGLGLAITRNLVRTMGGKITVKSEVGSGSTFTVTLPLVTPVAQKVSTGTLRPVLVN